MLFTPIVKRKKSRFPSHETSPFPKILSDDKKYTGIFTGFSVEIVQPCEIISIYQGGCFGKGCNSRSVPEILQKCRTTEKLTNTDDKERLTQESLVLDLEEAFFLSNYIGLLRIVDLDDNEMNWEATLKEFQKIKPNFTDCFAGYLYLKSKGWIVKSGTKFGGNFLLYKNGPKYFHASFIVKIVSTSNENEIHRAGKDVKGHQRVAETSDKDVLILEISQTEINSLDDFNNFTVSETIIRRFNYTAFVQT